MIHMKNAEKGLSADSPFCRAKPAVYYFGSEERIRPGTYLKMSENTFPPSAGPTAPPRPGTAR